MGGPLFGRLMYIPFQSEAKITFQICFLLILPALIRLIVFFSPMTFEDGMQNCFVTVACQLNFDWNLFRTWNFILFDLLVRFFLLLLIKWLSIYTGSSAFIFWYNINHPNNVCMKTWWTKRQKKTKVKLWTESKQWMDRKSKMSIQWTMMIERMQIYVSCTRTHGQQKHFNWNCQQNQYHNVLTALGVWMCTTKYANVMIPFIGWWNGWLKHEDVRKIFWLIVCIFPSSFFFAVAASFHVSVTLNWRAYKRPRIRYQKILLCDTNLLKNPKNFHKLCTNTQNLPNV